MTDEDDDVEAIKQRKVEQLKERAAVPDGPVHVEGADHFRELVAEHSPLLVDFHADWCGPCQTLEPVVETLAAETSAAVAKVDVEDRKDLAVEHSVQSIPTLLLFVDGELTERLVGAQDEATLRSLIESHS